jgi:hypothetical protein
MNTMAEVRKLTPSASTRFEFPIGYYELHPDISINFQLNRFYNWVGDDSMLTEMRETLGGVKDATDYPMFTRLVLDLGEKALARHEVLKGAYYLRLGVCAAEARYFDEKMRAWQLIMAVKSGDADQLFAVRTDPGPAAAPLAARVAAGGSPGALHQRDD